MELLQAHPEATLKAKIKLDSCAIAHHLNAASAALCKNPAFDAKTYSSSDGNLASRTAFASTFTVSCGGQAVKVRAMLIAQLYD